MSTLQLEVEGIASLASSDSVQPGVLGSIAIHQTVRFCSIIFSVYEYTYDVFFIFITLEEIERFRNDEQVI